MNTYAEIRRGPGWRQLAEAGRQGFHMAVERLRLYRQRSRQRRELHELDDRMLDDVGISREQAMQEARKPFWR